MQNNTHNSSESRSSLSLAIPQELLEDLRKLAEHNATSVEELVFSYIIEGLAGDSQLIKRLKFLDQATENLAEKGLMEKSPREIINDFNFLH